VEGFCFGTLDLKFMMPQRHERDYTKGAHAAPRQNIWLNKIGLWLNKEVVRIIGWLVDKLMTK